MGDWHFALSLHCPESTSGGPAGTYYLSIYVCVCGRVPIFCRD